ncbi:E3 ubiquitin-protein ligase TRIM71 [Holothuria leucospilota]|uniref:E3 ubiquitin-protein ligase TRIM71 n=1 Tax=Holothuria leucospilota TaxID=206669 RepID=A0A9Q1H9R9_HOLLE|nr:E3 ubiquitin-protein ligase TRIM71 [Holothuria leucospilota]
MRDAPRCHTHPEKISELYCVTCSNLPICMTCVYGEHKGHNLYEVKTLADLKRGELNAKLKILEQIEMNNKFRTPTKVKEKLFSNVNIEKRKAIKMHDEKYQEIVTKIQDIEEKRQQVKQERQNTEKKIFDPLQTKMEYEIQSIKKKYEEIFKVKKVEINETFQERESFLDKELSRLRKKLERFDREKEELLESIQKQLKDNVKTIDRISAHFDNIKKRLESLNVMASSILASDNDWSAVQCIPDMCGAAVNLTTVLQRDFQQLTTLTDVTVNYEEYSFGKTSLTLVFEQLRSQITINDPYRYVCSMTSTGGGNIAISGYSPENYSTFIIVVDMNGTILRETKLDNFGFREYLSLPELPRPCGFLPQYKVVGVCGTGKIGLLDVSNGSYTWKEVWSIARQMQCIATDPINNYILVGGNNSRDVYVLDDRLNSLCILTLPEMIKWPRDITVSNGHLLVCDYEGNKCYVTTMDRLESKLVGEFRKPYLGRSSFEPNSVDRLDRLESKLVGEFITPNFGGNSFRPISVCTDKNESVFTLWWCKYRNYGNYENSPQFYLVQYNHDGSQVLSTRKLDGGEACAPAYVHKPPCRVVTVVETSEGEELLAIYDKQTVSLYDLKIED